MTTEVEHVEDVDDRVERVLERYGLLEHAPRRELVALVQMAAWAADVPMATINLMTRTEQHQVATVGFDASVCRREDSMCTLAVQQRQRITVADASRDERFAANPFVTGELGDVRFYSTQPLVTPDGLVIGTLCVFDVEPRRIGDDRVAVLATLAERVVDVLELEVRSQELARALAESERLRGELERSNEQLGYFAGQVSHDLRNPLSTVTMSLYLLQDNDDPSVAAGMIDRALRGSQRMQGLIEDLLRFARVGAAPEREDVDLDELVGLALNDLGAASHDSVIEVGALGTVWGNPTQLRTVLQNLIANAVKFGAPGVPSHVEISARRADGTVHLEVADRGRGISPEDCARVFDPLVRVEEESEGSGIGLATCRRIVQAHHGHISIRPREGGGAVVEVELPER